MNRIHIIKELMKVVAVIAFFFHVCDIQAQIKNIDTVSDLGYYFNTFKNGQVLLKNGKVIEAKLNYHIEEQSIAFLQNEEILFLTNIADMDTVYIDDLKFIPIKQKFYEIVYSKNKNAVYVSYTNKPHPITSTADHNGISEQNLNKVSNTVSNAYLMWKQKDKFYSVFVPDYWVRKGDKLYASNNEKQVTRLYPKLADSIHTYIKKNNIGFRNIEDVEDIIDYCIITNN